MQRVRPSRRPARSTPVSRTVFAYRTLAVAAVGTPLLAMASGARANARYDYNGPFFGTAAVNLGSTNDMWFANEFTSNPAGQWITRLTTTFNEGFAVGQPVSVLLYQKNGTLPNGDLDLSLIYRLDSTVQAVNGNLYSQGIIPNHYYIPPTRVSGNFVVAVLAKNASGSATVLMDNSGPHGRSYFAYNDTPHAGTFDPANPNAADQPPVNADVVMTGNPNPPPTYEFYVQAVGRAAPAPYQLAPVTIDSFDDANPTTVNPNTGVTINTPAAIGGKRIVSSYDGASITADGKLSVGTGPTSVFYGWQNYGGQPGAQYNLGSGIDAPVGVNVEGYRALRFNIASAGPNARLRVWGTGFTTDAAGTSLTSSTGNANIDGPAGLTGAYDIPLSRLTGTADFADIDGINFTLYALGGGIAIDSVQLVPYLPGDANGDGTVNQADLDALLNGYANNLTGYTNGDFTGDHRVSSDDFAVFNLAFAQQQAAAGSPIPEPALPLAAAASACSIMIRRRKR